MSETDIKQIEIDIYKSIINYDNIYNKVQDLEVTMVYLYVEIFISKT